jgi:hypothetical protein
MFYSLSELLVLAALPVLVLWLQQRRGVILGEALLIVALVPLLFAFRSPPNYFAFAPWLALYAANRIYIARSQVPVTPASVAGRKAGVLA